MIYTNFVFFIVAIASFAMSPMRGANLLLFPLNLWAILMSLLWFWIYNRNKFLKLRFDLENEGFTIGEAKRIFQRILTHQLIAAVFFFIVETYLFDLKRILLQVPGMGRSEVLLNSTGLVFFILNLIIVWYWAYQAFGDPFSLGKSASHYIWGNIKFNMVTVIPWILFMAFFDVFSIENIPMLFQVAIFIGFMIVLAIFSPLIVVWMWDCKPMEDGEMKQEILAYCTSQGIKFKNIMWWNALNRSLVTAGVIGLIYPFRYLMITPELVRMLNRNELMAVVSHETAHVKKKHMFYYLLFFIGFLVISIALEDWMMMALVSTLGTIFRMNVNDTVVNLLQVSVTLSIFFLYFRFVFGYFMRNFERQADVYCCESGIHPDHMIGSFMKLRHYAGDEEKKSNWHHYTISQRMDFIQKCMEQPVLIKEHNRKVNRLVGMFIIFLVLVAVLSLAPYGLKTPRQIQLTQIEMDMLSRIEQEPFNFQWYMLLGMVSYEQEKWQQAQEAFEKSLKLKYENPEALNSLAWFYLTCPDEKWKNVRRGLALAQDAIRLHQAAHIFDTLAEGYFQNDMYKEAYLAAKQALMMANNNMNYYKAQLEKMYKFFLKSKSSLKI